MVYPRHLGQKYTLSWHDEQVTVFDCMERLQGYHYIAILDLDEFLIPRKEEYYDWKTMLVLYTSTITYPCNILKLFTAIKNDNFQIKCFVFSPYLCSKHRFWVHGRTASLSTSTHNQWFRAKILDKMCTPVTPSFTV